MKSLEYNEFFNFDLLVYTLPVVIPTKCVTILITIRVIIKNNYEFEKNFFLENDLLFIYTFKNIFNFCFFVIIIK